MTADGPISSSCRASAGASSSPNRPAERPANSDASVSFGVRMSTSDSSSAGSGCAGAGSSMVFAPSRRASRSAAATVSSGVSSWNNAYWQFRKLEREPSISDDEKIAFAPLATMIEFCPAASTPMSATPVASFRTAVTALTSTPAAARLAFRWSANTSWPTRPTIRTNAPSASRAVAHAWFAPFPPGIIWNARPSTVSPGAGRCWVRTTKSMFRLPSTTITGFTGSDRCRASSTHRRNSGGGEDRTPPFLRECRASAI